MVRMAGVRRFGAGRLLLWAVPTALLITPAVAMRFTTEVRWDAFDFAIAFVLLFGSAALIDLAIRKGGSMAYRLGVGLAVLCSFLLIWINGAVGMIGNEDNPANLLFLGIVLVAAAGSALARFRARGMARTMALAAVLQAAIAAMVPILAWGRGDPPGVAGLTLLIGSFAILWSLSAGLLSKAAHDQASLGNA